MKNEHGTVEGNDLIVSMIDGCRIAKRKRVNRF